MIPAQYLRSLSFKPDAESLMDEFPFTLPAVRDLEKIEFHPKVTFFIGENGSGKSTLLEALAIACGMNAEGGSKNFRFGTRESHSVLHRYLRVVRGISRPPMDTFFLRAESFFNVATEIENRGVGFSYGDRSLHEQSHGEAFLSLMMNRFDGHGLYLLDEPEAALSPQRQLSVLTRIHDLVKDCSQFVIATHSPILMAYPDAFIYEFSKDGLRRVAYEDTEHFRVTRDFLANPKRMLDILLTDKAP